MKCLVILPSTDKNDRVDFSPNVLASDSSLLFLPVFLIQLTDSSSDHMNNIFANRQPPKKKRKSRTAFTNHQIFELEKRFLYQKYLSPADRDELAGALGLTGAQVITWFQNRRAKLKRDVEELKKDMESAKMASIHKSLLLDPNVHASVHHAAAASHAAAAASAAAAMQLL